MAVLRPFQPLRRSYSPPRLGVIPDTDPAGRYGYGQYEAAPTLWSPALMPLPWPGGTKPTTGGGKKGSSGGVDWKKLLEELLAPLRLQFYGESGQGGERGVDAAQRAAAIQRGYIRFGENPDLDMAATDLGLPAEVAGDITPETHRLARQNTTAGLSITARLKEAQADAVRQIKNSLAARGMLRSGETGFQLGRAEQEASRAQYDARQAQLDYFAGVQAAFAQSERERARMLTTQGLGLFNQIPWGSTDDGGGEDDGTTDGTDDGTTEPIEPPPPWRPTFPFGAGPIGVGIARPRRRPTGGGRFLAR